jgi:magnesium-transporting ATPase (P-type)
LWFRTSLSTLSAVYSLLSALYSLLSALCSLLSALCSLLSALYSLLSALCSLLPALYSLLLCRESRAALVTSFGIFKYMAGYSITQFVSVMILYDIYSNLADFQFVWIDLFLITTMAALFGFNRAHAGPLAPSPPISSLFLVLPVFSLLGQLGLAIAVQVAVLLVTRSQHWFVPFDYQNPCYRNTSLEAAFKDTGIESYWGEEVAIIVTFHFARTFHFTRTFHAGVHG